MLQDYLIVSLWNFFSKCGFPSASNLIDMNEVFDGFKSVLLRILEAVTYCNFSQSLGMSSLLCSPVKMKE